MMAVYTVPAANVLTVGLQVMVPVYCAVSIAVVIGVAPLTGATTPGIANRVIGAADVEGNTAATVPVFATLVAVAPATVKLLAATPFNVQPVFAVNTMLAVYTVLAANGLAEGDQVIVPVYCAVSIAVVTGAIPRAGATNPGMANKVII
jgi:hypothetical protein